MWPFNQKTIQVWFAVNKNGFVGMWLDKPERNEDIGKWESNHCFVNSLIYPQICQLVEKAKMDWESDPEVVSFQ